jgi:hypothetical protein
MNCPPEIAMILLEILEMGLPTIPILGWNREADRCAVEADHLHNLPALLANYRPEKLLYYWEVERVGYVEETPPEFVAPWEALWRRLEPHVEATRRVIEDS